MIWILVTLYGIIDLGHLLSHPGIPGVTLCFCTGSYATAAAAAAGRSCQPQLLVHAITFEQLFGFLSFLARLLALTCRLPDYILVDFRRCFDLDFSRSNMEFAISQPKMVRLPRNEKQTYGLNSRPQMWPMGLTLTIILTFEIQRSNVTLTFDHTHELDHGFSCSNFEIAVSQNGRADRHCTKGVAVGHSWPWPWPFGD